MELIQTIQGAIDYMEAHITEPITYADVAKSLYLSGFHFHRTFSMVVGITPAEYLRRRRLSLAGEALSAEGGKVLDVALQYGYDSPESFTKAFTRFHGITPSAARRSGAVLRQFNRLSVKILVEGGDSMQYRIEKKRFLLSARGGAFLPERRGRRHRQPRDPQFLDGVRRGQCDRRNVGENLPRVSAAVRLRNAGPRGSGGLWGRARRRRFLRNLDSGTQKSIK